MIVLQTIFVAFSMFSALPVPQFEWNSRNMRYMMCAFPLVGVVCGVGWWAWSAVCGFFPVPALLRGAVLCLIPALITGGVHLDGYADTCDALASHAEPAKKQEILKDSHCGAFAVIRLCTYFVLHLALCTALEPTPRALWCMGLAFLLERALSGLAISRFPLAKNTGLAHTFATAADKKRVGWILLILCALLGACMIWLGGVAGAAMLVMGLLVFWRYRRMADRQFGGISGDLAGWFLQKAELWMLVALVACQIIQGGTPWF